MPAEKNLDELETLRQERDFLAAVIEALPIVVFCKDREKNFKYSLWNHMAEKILGVPADFALGKGDTDFFPREQAEFFHQKDLETLAQGTIVDIPEEPLDSASLGRIYLRTKKVPIRDSIGQNRYLLGISEDITAERQKAIEAQAVQVLARFCLEATTLNDLFEKLPTHLCQAFDFDFGMMALFDSEKRELECVGIHGPRDLESIGKRFRCDALLAGKAALSGIAQYAGPGSSELEHVHPGLRDFAAKKLFASPLKFEGRVLGTLTLASTETSAISSSFLHSLETISDIVAQTVRRLQIQATLVANARMASLGEMSSGIAHEINNPLTIISGRATHLRLLMNGGEPTREQLLEGLEKIESMVVRIARIVKGLRTFARDSEGDAFVRTKVSSLLQDARELCIERFRSRGVDLRIEEPVGLEIDCRPGQLVQTLVNLLSNAFDAIENLPQKWVEVRCEREGDSLRISITDSGKGIPRAIAERMMVPFFTTKAPDRGTGLGLSISRGIVASHGGTLTLDSSCSNTRFVIRLPLRQPIVDGAAT